MAETYDLIQKGKRIAHISERPHYCDRGRYHVNLELPDLWISEADPWPRYYFNFDYAKSELMEYLKAKKVDTTGAEWVRLVE